MRQSADAHAAEACAKEPAVVTRVEFAIILNDDYRHKSRISADPNLDEAAMLARVGKAPKHLSASLG